MQCSWHTVFIDSSCVVLCYVLQLFDLLGFEAMDFIQSLLSNRQMIVAGLLAESSEPAPSNGSHSGQNGGGRPVNKRPAYGCQVTVHSKQEKALQKMIRKEERREERRAKREGGNADMSLFMSREEMRMQR